ncbi:MAG: phosphatidate cytidylyltransferase [Polaribacter sp.]|nr:phosphatidate cytidylyltransferase [Polaribacter sp.]
MSNLTRRAISGSVYVSLFIFAILFNEKSYLILIGVFGLICLWELSKLIQLKSIIPYLLLPISIYCTSYYISKNGILAILGITLLCAIRLIFHLYDTKNKYPSSLLSKLDLTIRYLIFPFSFLALIPFSFGSYQSDIIICILIFIWINDSFAFIVGTTLGKNKLFKRVSPKKTIEGFLGGWLFSLVAAFIISKYHTQSNINLLDWILLASIVAVFGTIGDLIESKFKRQANAKDSGTLIPGHGGFLDRLDSLYFVAPFVYLYLHYII